jgi:hypothetical protein
MPSYTTLSQLTTAGSLADANLTLITAGTTSQNATLLTLKNYVLAGTAATATKLFTPRTINGVQFDGTANISIPFDISTGNAATATRLFTARTINGVSFDGSQNISIPITSLAFSNITALPTSVSGYGITDAVSLTGTQTLTNKTLTAPNISTITNTGTLTLPTSADTLVGRATTDTLTNKTISGSNNTISNIANASLTNSSITINGTTISLGGTATVGAVLANVLTIGDGISYTGASTYNGSTAVTIDLKPATDTQMGGVRVGLVATSGINNNTGTISLAKATTSQLGAVLVDGTSITATSPGGVITANAGGLSGTVLKSTVVDSSLTSFGASPALTTPAVTTSITTPSTTFALVNTTATTVNFAGAATALAIGASTGTTTVNNNLTVTGDLSVKGSVSFVESTTVQVADKNLELGKVASPTDVTANGGGITLKGATDKTISWSALGWTSSEDFNLATGKTYEINGTQVLSATTLGSGVTGSSLTGVGALTSGSIGVGFTAIPNTALANSAVTVGSTAISLGATSTTIAGLTSIDGTTALTSAFATPTGTVALFGSATTVNEFGSATTTNMGGAGVTAFIGKNTGNSTLSVLGNTSAGTATVTSNVTGGIVNLFSGVTGTINIGAVGSSTNYAGTLRQNGIVVPNLITMLTYQLAL